MKVPFNISLRRSFRAIATTVCAVVLSSTAAFAQDGAGESGSKLLVGFKTGFTLTDMRTGSDMDFFQQQEGMGKQIGANVLGFARYDFTKWVGGEFELGWTQNAYSSYLAAGAAKSTYRTFSVQVNGLLNVRIPVLSVYEPRFYIGPSYNYNYKTIERRQDTNLDYWNDATSTLRPHDIGAIVGFTTQFDLKFAKLLVDARYRHGFTELKNSRVVVTGQDLSYSPSLRMSDMAFMVGLGFPIM